MTANEELVHWLRLCMVGWSWELCRWARGVYILNAFN